MTEQLEKIAARLPCDEMTVGAGELGAEALDTLKALKVTQSALVLRGAKRVNSQSKPLWISGSAQGVFGDATVALDVLLIDSSENRREWLILARRPDSTRSSERLLDRLIVQCLSRFESAPIELFTAIEDVAFCAVASAGFARQETLDPVMRPDGLGNHSFVDLGDGITFHAERVAYDEDIADSVQQWAEMQLLAEGPATVRIAPGHSSEGPILSIHSKTRTESVSLPWFKADLAPALFLLPLEPHVWSGPRFLQRGTLAFPSDWPGAEAFRAPSFKAEAEVEFDIRWRTTTARLRTPPGFGVFQGLLGDLPDQSIGDSLLTGVVGEAWIRGNWSPDKTHGAIGGSVLALGGAVGWKDPLPIVLVPDVLTFVGGLSFAIERPFDAETRAATGRIEGSLRLLHKGTVAASLSGSLDIPSWHFTASAEALNLGALWQAFGSDAALPAVLRNAAVRVDLWGDVRTPSFGASIEFISGEGNWSDSGDGFKWALEQIALGVSYEEGAFTFGIAAQLTVQDLQFQVQGGYADGGWYLEGGTAKLDVSKAVNGLLQGLTLPEGMPAGLTLTDVGFEARFSAGYISLRGRTDGSWEIANKISLGIESMSLERDGKTTAACLVVRLAFEEFAVRLEAVKVGGEGSWIFKGALAPGSKIGFASVYRKLSDKTEEQATQELPDELRDFSIDQLAMSYETGPKRFEALCSGHLLIQGRRLEAAVTVKVEGSVVNCLVDVTFDEHLTFKGKVVVGADAKAIILGFKDTDQKGVLLTDLLSKALPGDVVLPLEVGLKDALLAYHTSKTSKALILGATLNVNFALGDALPPALVALIGKPEIGVDALRVLYADAALAEADRVSLNANLQSLGQALPSASGGAKELRKGFHASGSLKFGGLAATPLMLPMSAPASVPARGGYTMPPKADMAEDPSGATWIDIGKSLGPLRISRVGAQYANGKIGVLLDAGVDLAGLRIGLTGFAVHIPLQKGQSVAFGLDGLELAYAGGPVEIAGALLRRRVADKPDSYDGLAMIKAATFSISGMGSITTIENAVSVFIFAALHGELGGPPAFRVQGIAGGFGYNRRLTLPPIERIHQFPLVRAAMDASFMTASSKAGESPAQAALKELATYIRPSLGDYWLAAGIKFNSFQMITAVALVSVSFGSDVEIGLLGLAEMSLPKGVKEVELAYVELALRCSIKPSDGSVMVEGRLTDASYILSKDCRLTGGFAFCLWFDGPHTGDFVVTLGGYHPKFTPLPHYPVVPRVGVQWQVTKELSFAAELYFALTPSCIMAGGRFAAIYTLSSVRAWFVASVDFLIAWQPLQYRVEAALRIGFEVDVGGSALRLDLRAELILWGPPFAGQLHVDLGILMVTVDFGEAYKAPEPLSPDQFKGAFLPKISDNVFEVLSARVESGLILQETRTDQSPLHVVTAHALSLSVQSVVPMTAIELVDHDVAGMLDTDKPITGTLGVAPMASTSLDAPLSLSIVTGDGDAKPVKLRSVKLSCIQTGVPEALWKPAKTAGELRETRASAGTMRATTGLRLRLDPIAPSGASPVLEIDKLQYEDFP